MKRRFKHFCSLHLRITELALACNHVSVHLDRKIIYSDVDVS
jgi:hypothetical protein